MLALTLSCHVPPFCAPWTCSQVRRESLLNRVVPLTSILYLLFLSELHACLIIIIIITRMINGASIKISKGVTVYGKCNLVVVQLHHAIMSVLMGTLKIQVVKSLHKKVDSVLVFSFYEKQHTCHFIFRESGRFEQMK